MNQLTQAAQTVEIKQTIDFQKTTEKFDVVTIANVNNQFNITVTNRGDIPVHFTRLWVENTTSGSTWPVSKYNLDVAIPSGGTVTNIGQNIGLTAMDTQSYMMKLVTERGNTQKLFVNSVGSESIYLSLRATPTIVPTTFTTTLVLEVINTGTNNLINLVPEIDTPVTSCAIVCSAELASGPSPSSFDVLSPGDIAIFEWVYTITGESTGDSATFTARLVNGIDEDTATVTVQPIINAENANIALSSGGLVDDSTINNSVLIFHLEQAGVPSPGYEMMSSDVDGGSSGLLINMETFTAGNAAAFMTNNGSNTITIPAGKWNASLALRSEPVATLLKDVTNAVDMIFHFEDGDGVNPDNSEGDSDRDLENCNVNQFQELIQDGDDDSTQDDNLGGDTDNGSSFGDHELVYDDGSADVHQYVGLRWALDVPQGATITSAIIRFTADESDSGTSPDIIIGAEDTDNAGAFVDAAVDNIEDRWDGTSNTVTTATVVWDDIPDWTTGESGTDTDTPNLKTIVQEIVDRDNWVSGNNIVFILKDNSGGSNINQRVAEQFNAQPTQAARLTVTWGAAGVDPDWQAGEGPHGSGAYYYDGISSCHRSTNDVSNSDGNEIESNDNTTSLWFKTDGVDQVSSEQMLVFWEGGGIYPNSDYYKISLGEDGTGTILFEYSLNPGLSDVTTCRSVNEYDDENWHHIVAVRDASIDECDLYITDINGIDEETPINGNDDNSGWSVSTDGKWYVASAEGTDDYFKGWIDDIMHWDDEELTSAEADDLSLTNYGTKAHELDVNLDLTDENGSFLSNLYSGPATAIAFQDSKSQSDSTDSAYTMINVTMNLPEIIVLPLQRLNFSMAFVPSTSAWEALELDMKIDDTGFTTPHPSYLQMPTPDIGFPSYVIYHKLTEMKLLINNVGDDGIYFIYSGTRLSFDGDLGSYATLIHSINGTGESFKVDIDRDSIYIAANDTAEMFFYASPTDHPCQAAGNTCLEANVIPAGDYRVAAWVNGYSDQGETFGRSVILGNVVVLE